MFRLPVRVVDLRATQTSAGTAPRDRGAITSSFGAVGLGSQPLQEVLKRETAIRAHTSPSVSRYFDVELDGL